MTVDELLKIDEIDIVVNLTDPGGPLRDLEGRSSTPASTSIRKSRWRCRSKDAAKLVAEADKRGLKLGGAPDTFLGAGAQLARKLIDKGKHRPDHRRHRPMS